MERQFLMMLLLTGYVIHRLINHRLTYRKCGIACLPSKMLVIWRQVFYPATAVAFNFLNKIRNGYVIGQQTHHVNMVADATHTDNITPRGIYKLTYITMHAIPMLLMNLRTHRFDVKNNVQVYFTK